MMSVGSDGHMMILLIVLGAFALVQLTAHASTRGSGVDLDSTRGPGT
jgi:hypothetical protein